jgi:hypothetical protein
MVAGRGFGIAFHLVHILSPAHQNATGRALGAHNTLQNAFAVATPPMLGAVVAGAGYAAAFAAAVAFPLAAAVVTPVSAESSRVTPRRRPPSTQGTEVISSPHPR